MKNIHTYLYKNINKYISTSVVLIIFLLLNIPNGKAQWYGQQTYRVDSVLLTSAKVASAFPGYIMGGRRGVRQNGSTSPDFVINKTDVNGQLTSATDFINEYQINGCGNTPHNCAGISLVECINPVASNGSTQYYAIAVSSTAGIGFATLDQTGTPVQELFWDFPTQVSIFELKNPAIRESATANQFYLTCNYQYSTCVMKVDASVTPPNIMWSNLYYNNAQRYESRDIIESPFTTNEVMVVGRTDMDVNTLLNGWAANAFFTVLDATSGAVITHSIYNKQYDGDDWFACIEPAYSSTGGSQGFILGGRSFYSVSAPSGTLMNNNYMQWVCKLDPSGAFIWSDLIQPGTIHAQGYQQEISRVYERLNSNNGNYEVYATAGMGGCTQPSTVAGNCSTAQVVYKLDDAGQNVFTPDEFHYYGAWMNQGSLDVFSDVQITGIENGLGDDGIQVYGSDTYAANFLITKAYFNGEVGCNQATTTIQQIIQGPDSIRTENLNVVGFQHCPAPNWINFNPSSVTPATLCSSSSLANGSNAKIVISSIQKKSATNSGIDIFPNPSDSKFLIKSKSGQTLLRLVLFDLTGRKVWETSLLPQVSTAELDFNKLGFEPGIYNLQVQCSDTKLTNHKILFKN